MPFMNFPNSAWSYCILHTLYRGESFIGSEGPSYLNALNNNGGSCQDENQKKDNNLIRTLGFFLLRYEFLYVFNFIYRVTTMSFFSVRVLKS